ncbi:hypothetical protein L3Y34_001427 [Caenorhabditis briggsae]|uniref:Uncharacterized protein n=1 Tax=Caenorhabditis briggsae TaxID=6238 RepID=A0AAE9DC42_CAEBR|nr:hypothetical protein L3Y34_001427 [Caenorhabditis briggsae]
MNILGLLLLLVLAIAAPIAEAGRRCRSSHQCDYQSVCYNGYCYTIDEMFEKFEMKRAFLIGLIRAMGDNVNPVSAYEIDRRFGETRK